MPLHKEVSMALLNWSFEVLTPKFLIKGTIERREDPEDGEEIDFYDPSEDPTDEFAFTWLLMSIAGAKFRFVRKGLRMPVKVFAKKGGRQTMSVKTLRSKNNEEEK